MDDAGNQRGLDDEQHTAAEAEAHGQKDPEAGRAGALQQPFQSRLGRMRG